MAVFGPKPWVNPFGKIPILLLFQLGVFIGWKGFFSRQNILKDIFLAYFTYFNEIKKLAIFYQNHGLTFLKKSQFFHFFNFLFLQARKAFFLVRILSKTFSWLVLPILKRQKHCQRWTNPFGKIPIFPLFYTL